MRKDGVVDTKDKVSFFFYIVTCDLGSNSAK